MADEKEILIGEIDKGKDKIKMSINTFKGKTYVDCRVFYESEGKWLPTKKGFTINKISQLAEIGILFEKAAKEYTEEEKTEK